MFPVPQFSLLGLSNSSESAAVGAAEKSLQDNPKTQEIKLFMCEPFHLMVLTLGWDSKTWLKIKRGFSENVFWDV